MEKTTENKNLRNICLNMLSQTLDQGKLSHYVIRDEFASNDLKVQEKAFIRRLFSGVLEKLVYLDYAIGQFSNVPLKKMKPVIRNILRMGIYQLEFMDGIPDYSVIDECVKLTRIRGLHNLCSFVNAILRKYQREAGNLILPEYVKALFPEWIYNLILNQYGEEKAIKYFNALQKENIETVVRYNLAVSDEKTVTSLLEEEGCSVRKICLEGSKYSAYGISGFDELTGLKAFKNGMIIVQDPSSMMSVINAQKYIETNNLTVDVCASPGGKSLMMAQIYPDAQIISRDLTQMKADLMLENINRLGAGNIKVQVADARIPDNDLFEKADVVIADLPCSGLGVTDKKPDILFRLKKENLQELSQLQRQILGVVRQYVKPGGILIYSTCTINKEENEKNTEWILGNGDFTLLEEKTFLKDEWEFDGFYYAYFRKN